MGEPQGAGAAASPGEGSPEEQAGVMPSPARDSGLAIAPGKDVTCCRPSERLSGCTGNLSGFAHTIGGFIITLPAFLGATVTIIQLSKGCYADRPEELRTAILKELSLEQQAEQPVGTVARISAGENTYLLLATADRHEQTRSSVAVDAVWSSLSQLWQYARLNNISRLRVPVVGSGFAVPRLAACP